MKEKESTFQVWFVVVISLLTSIPSMLWMGWVASKMWQWFAQEQFGLPHISTVQMVGVQLIIASLTVHFARTTSIWEENPDYTSTTKLSKGMAVSLVGPAIIILAGWGWRQFL